MLKIRTKINSFLPRLQYSTSSASPFVILKKINNVGQITLNRPKVMNVLNLEVNRNILARINEWERDDHVKIIVIKGAGETAFCAGGDIREFRDLVLQNQLEKVFEYFRSKYVLDYTIANLKKPYVALLNGITMGAGVGISVHGKYRVATEKTVFSMPETAIGFLCDVGTSYVFPRLADNLGLYLALTGHRLKGQDVKFNGLATHFVSAKNLENLENEFLQAKCLSSKSVEEILNKFNEPVKNSDDLDKSAIKRCFSSKTLEQILANLEKENSDWARNELDILSKRSPISLKVCIRQQELGVTKSLKECLEMDYMMSVRFAWKSDFVEGVRAFIVDKCKKPKWAPASHTEVTDEQVDWYFKSNKRPEHRLILEGN